MPGKMYWRMYLDGVIPTKIFWTWNEIEKRAQRVNVTGNIDDHWDKEENKNENQT